MQGHFIADVPVMKQSLSIRNFVIIMDSYENKVTKPSDNVITPEEKPSSAFGILLLLTLLGISLLFASLYFGILKI